MQNLISRLGKKNNKWVIICKLLAAWGNGRCATRLRPHVRNTQVLMIKRPASCCRHLFHGELGPIFHLRPRCQGCSGPHPSHRHDVLSVLNSPFGVEEGRMFQWVFFRVFEAWVLLVDFRMFVVQLDDVVFFSTSACFPCCFAVQGQHLERCVLGARARGLSFVTFPQLWWP